MFFRFPPTRLSCSLAHTVFLLLFPLDSARPFKLRLAVLAAVLAAAAAPDAVKKPMLTPLAKPGIKTFSKKYIGSTCVLPLGCGSDIDCSLPPVWDGFNMCNHTGVTNDRELCAWIKQARDRMDLGVKDGRGTRMKMFPDEELNWRTSICRNFMYEKDAQCAVRVSDSLCV